MAGKWLSYWLFPVMVTWGARLSWLLCGLALYGVGLAAQVRASIGLAPWSVVSQGVSLSTGLTFEMATNAIGLLVLALWIPLRQRSGVGTVLNVVVIGTVLEAMLIGSVVHRTLPLFAVRYARQHRSPSMAVSV